MSKKTIRLVFWALKVTVVMMVLITLVSNKVLVGFVFAPMLLIVAFLALVGLGILEIDAINEDRSPAKGGDK